MVKSLSILVAAAIGAISPSDALAAELVTNGGFETGSFSGWSVAGATDSGVDSLNPYAGSYAAYFGDPTATTISQSLATTAGQVYDLSFAIQVEDGVSGTAFPNSFLALFGGQTVYAISNNAAFSYRFLTFPVTATSNSTLLSFTGLDGPAYIDLDAISVMPSVRSTALPEPTSWVMMLIGFAAAGASFRRRSTAGAAAPRMLTNLAR